MRRAWLAAAVLLAGCSSLTEPEPPVARLIPCPAAPGGAEPNLTTGRDGKLYLSWVEPGAEADHALRFSVLERKAWSEPRTVAQGEHWFVNWADFPSLSALEDGTLAAHWLAKSGPGTYAYDVWLAISRDGGHSWSQPVRPHRDATQAEHGFVTLVPNGLEGFDVVWLDGRETTGDSPGPMTLRHARLGTDGRVGPDAPIDERVCDCCSTDAVRTASGDLIVAYRDRSDDEIRDIAVSRLDGGRWSAPVTVHDDGWKIEACPVNGPALATGGDRVAVAWFTLADGSPRVRLAWSDDGGRSFGRPVDVDEGQPHGRVDVVLSPDGTAWVSWLEQRGDHGEIRLRPVRYPGRREPSLVVARTSAARTSGFPRLARADGANFVAWTEPGRPTRVRSAVLRVP